MPRVSVIIPVHNAAPFITEAVESVLGQTYQGYEVIVVDDGSTDGTEAVLAPYKKAIRYISQPHRGVSAARNAGIRAASGEYLAWLDADDTWRPRKLEQQIAFLEGHPEVAIHFTDFEVFDARGVIHPSGLQRKAVYSIICGRREGVVPEAFLHLVTEGYFFPSVMMVRRRALEIVGLFDEEIRYNEDRELGFRISRQFPIGYTLEPLGRRRKHGASATVNESHIMLQVEAEILRLLPKRVGALSSREACAVHHRLGKIQLELGEWYLEHGEQRLARLALSRGLRYGLRVRTLSLLTASCLPGTSTDHLRRIKRAVFGAAHE